MAPLGPYARAGYMDGPLESSHLHYVKELVFTNMSFRGQCGPMPYYVMGNESHAFFLGQTYAQMDYVFRQLEDQCLRSFR